MRSSLCRAALALCLAGAALPAQRPTARIGAFFWHDSPNDETTLAGVRLGLEQAGFPHEIVIRRADSDADRAKACLEELRAAGVQAVLALGTQAALVAKAEVHDRPIVFAAVTNPVAAGVTADWGPAGGNLCGASNWIDPDAVLATFRLAVPRLQRLGVLRSRTSGVVSAAELASMRAHLAEPGTPPLELLEQVADDEAGLAAAVARLTAARVDAIWVPIDLTVYQNVPAIERALGADPVPLLSTAAAGVRNGAMVGTAVDYRLHGQRAAALLLAVLRDRKPPGTLPVDRMRSTAILVNLGAARRTGAALPLSLLVIADDLIPADERTEGAGDGPR